MNTATYSLLTLYPDADRVDVLCVGVVALDAQGLWHVAVLPTADKLRAVATSAQDRLQILARNLHQYLAECDTLAAARSLLVRPGSALALHDFEGVFSYSDAAAFNAQMQAIMAESVLPPAPADGPRAAPETRTVRQHTRAKLRRQFEHMGIMARHADQIADHKVVRNFPVSTRHGLTAEFALKNTVMHFTETVDFDVAEDSVRGKTFEAQAKCLVLRSATETFGAKTQCHIVISGSSAQHAARTVDLLSTVGHLYSVESGPDMAAYFEIIARAAGSTGQIALN
jgi:hypothetical protein